MVTEKDKERIIVLYKPTQLKVSIMRKQFDGQCHELIEPVTVTDEPVVEVVVKEETVVEMEVVGKVRYEELFAIGWANLKGDVRREYQALKKIYAPKS